MGILARILGICKTGKPQNPDCWQYNEGAVTVDLSRAPELSQPGGAIRLEGKGMPRRLLLFCGQDGNFHAFSNHCTHMGRRIDPLPDQAAIQCCSVLGSRYDYNGKVLSGAARSDLPRFPVEKGDNQIRIPIGEGAVNQR